MRILLLGLFLLLSLASSRLEAQDVSIDEEETNTDSAKPSDSKPPREQTIYVPYEKLRNTFEKEGRGVFIPYEKFQELWKAAREAQKQPVEMKLPASAVITEADSVATVAKDVVQVKARLKIDLLAPGWIKVPLHLQGAGIISARQKLAQGQEEPARLALDENGGYQLLVENRSKKPQAMELQLEYAQEYRKSPGKNEVSFAAPRAPVNRWRVQVPEAGVKVNIDPMIAATEPPGNNAETSAKETVVLAFVGAAPHVKIDWTAKAEGASGLAAVATVESQHTVRIDEGAVRSTVRLNYTINRAELTQLLVEVPVDQRILNVSAANVRQWNVATENGKQKITVQLFEPARQTESILVELEKFTDASAENQNGPDQLKQDKPVIKIPEVKALDVSRQQGFVVVAAGGSLQLEAKQRQGLVQIDAADLPPTLAKVPHTFAYRFSALPYALEIQATKIKPLISVEEFVSAYLQPERLTLNLQAAFTIERAGVFELHIDAPPGFEVRSVRGDAVLGSAPAPVGGYHLEGDKQTKLIVELSNKTQGKFGVFVQFQKELEDPNLLGPTGKAASVELPLPRASTQDVERTAGRLLVNAPESLRVNPERQSGLRNASVAEVSAGLQMAPPPDAMATRPVSSFVFGKSPVELSLTVERRKPYVSVGQLLAVRVDPGIVSYNATFHYDIRYSGVKSLRVDLPAKIAPLVRNLTPGISDKPISPAPQDIAPDYVAWSLTGDQELLGAITITLSWQKKLDELEVGKSIDLAIPRILPPGVDRAWGQITLAKAETIDLASSSTATGLRPIDPQQDLMPGANVSDAALAFEFHDDWSLNIAATRYQLENVKNTSIERGVVRAVFTRGKQLAVQALYRLRSARQRLTVELPEGVEFDTEPLRINGQGTPLERGSKGEYFIPLSGRGNVEALLVEIRYLVPESNLSVTLPHFPDEAAVQKVYLSTFIPDEFSLMGYRGPWTDEQTKPVASWGVYSRSQSDPELVQWVSEGIQLGTSPLDTFPVDGRSLIYSTLRPQPGEAGSLRLSALQTRWLQAFVFAGVLGLGIALVRRPARDRVIAVSVFLIGLLLLGVFLPTLSLQVLRLGFWLALLLIVILWFAAMIVRRKSSIVATPATDAATTPPAPPPETSPTSEATDGGERHE